METERRELSKRDCGMCESQWVQCVCGVKCEDAVCAVSVMSLWFDHFLVFMSDH